MKGFVLWVVAGTALVVFLCISLDGSTSSVPDVALTHLEDDLAVMKGSRKLKEIDHTTRTDKSASRSANLEDYESIDPVPSSMASIRPGPIQHGTPIMPYIPKPSPPPEHPKQGGSP